MQIVPLTDAPNQTLQIVLGGQNCAIAIDSMNGSDPTDLLLSTEYDWLAFTLVSNGIDITTNASCLNLKRLLINRQYLGFVGDFMFVDTQGALDPEWEGLGTRWVLLYLEAADL